MNNGYVGAICISPEAGAPMRRVDRVRAIAGQGLEGDRYFGGRGSWNKGKPGKRQVTLINAAFFHDTGILFEHTRRNLLVEGEELMRLIGEEFHIGGALMRGVKYCAPCHRPDVLVGRKGKGFLETFWDKGGLIAEVLKGGLISVGDPLIYPPPAV
jgi:hypothetical protein